METIAAYSKKLKEEISKIMVGKQEQIDMILTAVFAGGHVLLNDLPGSGKTTLVKTISAALGCEYRRIQFTPDLLPSDIVGTTIFNQQTSAFQVKKGPIHTNILLADEINRAIPRTQSALLEAMEEGQITIDGKTYPLPRPFLVLATQNPVDRESTFMLPAAQMDRFFLCLSMGYPTKEEEIQILQNLGDGIPYEIVRAVTDAETICALRSEVEKVHLSGDCIGYIVALVQATRSNPLIAVGASPRASRSLYQGSKAYAAMQGREYVLPEDIQKIFLPVLCHRITLSGEARYQKKTENEILTQILEETAVLPQQKELFHARNTK